MKEIHLQHLRDVAKRHDYDLYLCSLLSHPSERPAIWALMALDHELARIPSVTAEEMIRMIRLTWWREAIEEIYAGKPVRKHEVAEPLAEAITEFSIAEPTLMTLWEARQAWVLEEGSDEACYIALWKCIAQMIGEDSEMAAKLAEVYVIQRTLRHGGKRHSYEVSMQLLQKRIDDLPPVDKFGCEIGYLRNLVLDYHRRLTKGEQALTFIAILRPSLTSYARLAYAALRKKHDKRKT